MTFTVNDTAPDFTATLLSAAAPANLLGATVALHLEPPSGRVLSVVAQIVAPLSGTIVYRWLAGDLSEAGQWHWEAEVTFADAQVQTFPGTLPFAVADEIA